MKGKRAEFVTAEPLTHLTNHQALGVCRSGVLAKVAVGSSELQEHLAALGVRHLTCAVGSFAFLGRGGGTDRRKAFVVQSTIKVERIGWISAAL